MHEHDDICGWCGFVLYSSQSVEICLKFLPSIMKWNSYLSFRDYKTVRVHSIANILKVETLLNANKWLTYIFSSIRLYFLINDSCTSDEAV